MRVYDLNAANNEIYSEIETGVVEIVEEILEDTNHVHNIVDHCIEWTDWNNFPSDYLVVYVSDLLDGNEQVVGMV